MDLNEINQKLVIWNPKLTHFSAILVWAFCCHCMVKAVLEQVKYSGVTSTGKRVGIHGHKISTFKVWGTYSSVADSSSCLEYLLFWLLTVTNISKHHRAFNFRTKCSRILEPVSVWYQKNIGCGQEDMEGALSIETSHRYTVKFVVVMRISSRFCPLKQDKNTK